MIGRRREKRRQREQRELERQQRQFAASPEAAEYNKLAAQAKQFGVDTSKMGKFGFGNSGNAQIVSQMRDQINQRSIGQSGGNRPTMTFGDAAPAALQATNPKPMPIPPSFRPLMPGAQPQPGQPQPGQDQTKPYKSPPSNALGQAANMATMSLANNPMGQLAANLRNPAQQQPTQQQQNPFQNLRSALSAANAFTNPAAQAMANAAQQKTPQQQPAQQQPAQQQPTQQQPAQQQPAQQQPAQQQAMSEEEKKRLGQM